MTTAAAETAASTTYRHLLPEPERRAKLELAQRLALFAAGCIFTGTVEAISTNEALGLTLDTRRELGMKRNQPTPKQLAAAALFLAQQEARAADMPGWNVGLKVERLTQDRLEREAKDYAEKLQGYLEHGMKLRELSPCEKAVPCVYCGAPAGEHCRFDVPLSGERGGDSIAYAAHHHRSADHARWLEEHKPSCARCGDKLSLPGEVFFEHRVCNACFEQGLAGPEMTLPSEGMSSWKAEVLAGEWSSNALRFKTKEEAEAYAWDLFMRWTVPTDKRVVESMDPVNYQFSYPDGLVAVQG